MGDGMGGSGISKVVVYISAFDGDGSRIDLQRGRVEPLAAPFDGGHAKVVVDIGWPDGNALCPPGLFGILKASRVRAIEMVAVESIARFARDRHTAARIAGILCDAGVQIREATRSNEDLGTNELDRKPSLAGKRARRARLDRNVA